jgi:small ligand-binding sensory domain FIST
LSELLDELSLRHDQALCFGGVCSGLEGDLPQVANEVLFGGLSGLVLTQAANIRSSFSQGCLAIGSKHQITGGERHLVRRIDDRPAMDVLLQELGISQDQKRLVRGSSVLDAIPQEKLQGGLLVEIADPQRSNQHGYVRNLLGIDPSNGTIAIAGQAKAGWSLRFCTREPQAARADLIASCTALRESIEEAGQKLLAVIYISCLARGQHLFGQAGLEGQWVQHYLQAPVMIGFQANGEIHQNQLHGYSSVILAICD